MRYISELWLVGGLIRGVVDGDGENEKMQSGAISTSDGKKKAGTDEIRTREVSHHGLVET